MGEGMPQGPTPEEAKEMAAKGEGTMTPTEEVLSRKREGNLNEFTSAMSGLEDPVQFAKNIEFAREIDSSTAQTTAEQAFGLPIGKILAPEGYSLKMKGREFTQVGAAQTKKGLMSGWKQEYYVKDQEGTIDSMTSTPREAESAKNTFKSAKIAAKIMEQEAAAGRATEQISEEVRQQILEQARREGAVQ